jgi:hypothetical protein
MPQPRCTETNGGTGANLVDVARLALLVLVVLGPIAVAHAQSADHGPTDVAALERAAWDALVTDRPTDVARACVPLLDRLPAGPRHDEALVLLAAVLADVDWDRDGLADERTPLSRLTTLVPLDRPWSAELAYATAHALFVSSRDPEAIAVIEWAASRWPLPEGGTSMAAACRRHRARPETLHRESASVRAEASAICGRRGL